MVENVLVVDNHPVVLKFMTHLLEKEGYQVRTAENGLAALDILETFTPEVAFVDLIMPNIDGEKLCQVIRRIPRLKDTYLVVLSAIATEQEIDIASFGANACIAKGPFNKLAEHVLSLLKRQDLNTGVSLPGQAIGMGDLHPRHITEELLSIKKHFEAILNGMSEGILEITPEERIVYANPAILALTGIPEEKLLASNFIELFDSEDQKRVRDRLTAPGDTPHPLSKEETVRLNDKQVSLSVAPVNNLQRQDVIVILSDESERKRMETQLLQAQKMESIGTLAGGIAHDFNNLLMVIQGNVSLMLLDVNPSHPHYQMLKNIETKVESGAKLTSQLLGYARKGKYETRPLQLNPLVETLSITFGRTRKDITVHRELAEGLFQIEADQGQLEQVLMNLMVNAGEAMPEGGTLFLKTANVRWEGIADRLYGLKQGEYILLQITDTGVGMDSKTLDRVFDPFFTTKGLGIGTGLGLASVYGIIKGHHGHIVVESEKGQGTTFKIYLPGTRKREQKTVTKPSPALKGAKTILLVDDEEMVVDVGQKLLKVMGYHVITALNGRDAVELYAKHRAMIDLVLLDIIMPHMKGGEVFDRLVEINPEVKVLLSSGYSVDGEATEILERGGSGFIQKPFDMKQLSLTLRSILEK